MKSLLPLVSAMALFVSSPVLAAQAGTAEDLIDAWLEAAVQKDPSTAGVRNATNRAREMWDEEMNSCYKRLMSQLDASQQAALRASQRDWLKFRDSEFKTISQIVTTRGGTMWQVVATSGGMRIVKDRTLQLRGYEAPVDD